MKYLSLIEQIFSLLMFTWAIVYLFINYSDLTNIDKVLILLILSVGVGVR